MIRVFRDYIIFKTNLLFEDHVQYKGINGEELSLDSSFDPAKNCRIYGEVVTLPEELSKGIPINQEHRGMPAYHEESPFRYKYIRDVQQEVQIGDRIYFHYNTVKPHNFMKIEGKHPEKTWWIKVRYDQIICAVRNGEIIMIAGYCLIDPDFEDWKDISIPTYSDLLDENGQKILKPESQWLVTKSAPGYKYLRGIVKKVGSPLIGDTCEIKEGQRIWYHKNADWMVKIEGRDYFVIKQRHIIGREE